MDMSGVRTAMHIGALFLFLFSSLLDARRLFPGRGLPCDTSPLDVKNLLLSCFRLNDHLPMIRFHGEGGQSSAWQSQRIGVVTEGQGDNCWDL